jgi:hypothetical protein
MLPHGAQHPGGMAVPAIRVGAGGHWPRRTSQLAPIRLCQHARGTARSAVEGAPDSTRRKRFKASSAPTFIVLQRQQHVESGAPSTTVRSLRELQWSPSPLRGGGRCEQARSRGALRARVLQQERKPLMFRLQINKGRRSAGRRESNGPHHTNRCRHLPALRARRAPRTIRTVRFGRARLSALHRGFDRGF